MFQTLILLGAIAGATIYLTRKVNRIMSTVDQANAKLDSIAANLTEASTEIVAGLQDLRDQLAALPQSVPDSVMSRLDDLDQKSRALADIFPNTPA